MVRKAFLPGDYSPPVSDKFFKPSPGENRIRILSEVVTGYVSWVDKDGKRVPIRDREMEIVNVDPAHPPKFFWAMVVFNYRAVKNPDNTYSGRVQLWEMTQSGLRTTFEGWLEDPDWGDLRDYDIGIMKKGEGMDTTYQAVPKPKMEVAESVEQAYEESGMSPQEIFGSTKQVPTPEQSHNAEPAVEDVPF